MRLLYLNDKFNNQDTELSDEAKEILVRDLELDKLIKKMTLEADNPPDAKYLLGLMSCNPEVISYRQQLSKNLFENEGLYKEIYEIYLKMKGLKDISTDMTQTARKEIANYVIIIKWLDLFCTLIKDFTGLFNKYNQEIDAGSLLQLKDTIYNIHSSKEFEILSKNIDEMKTDSHKLNSIRLGINLNDYLEPVSVRCLEIDEYYYNPRKVADIKKNDGKVHGIGRFKYVPAGKRREGVIRYDEIHARAVLVNTTKIQRFVSCDIDVEYIKGLNSFFKTLNFNSRNVVKRFILDKTSDLLELVDDLGFFLGGIKMIKYLDEKGMPVCLPEIGVIGENNYIVKDLYNCYLPSIIPKPTENIVCNDLELCKNTSFSILNGPNKGGKTTLIQALCLSVIFFQLGLYAPCSKAVISPVDMIITHYQREEKADRTGRLAIEADSMRRIFNCATQNSMVILNEPYVSTSPAEGMFLILNSLSAIRELKCRGILVTHYHKLNDSIAEDNRDSDFRISFLNMGIASEDGNAKRTYELKKGRGEVKSFAMDILKEYAPGLLSD